MWCCNIHQQISIRNSVNSVNWVDGSQLDIIAYTDNKHLFEAVYSMEQTLEKHLIVSSIWKTIERNETEVTWLKRKGKLSY